LARLEVPAELLELRLERAQRRCEEAIEDDVAAGETQRSLRPDDDDALSLEVPEQASGVLQELLEVAARRVGQERHDVDDRRIAHHGDRQFVGEVSGEAREWGRPARGEAPPPNSQRGDRRLVLLVGVENQIAHAILRRGVRDRPQQREAATLAVDRVLPSGKRDRPSAAAALPNRKADQLQSVQRAAGEVQLGIRELAREGCLCRSERT
jgi:hypothetical protein